MYSHLNQVIKLIDEEQGLAVLSGSSANFVPKYILPHYNGATLFPPTNYKKTMCFNPSHYYLGAKNNDAQYAWTTGYGSYISTPFGSTTSIELPDGTCIGFNTLVNSNYYPDTTIFVDVNGSATPPNRSGRDLFLFYLDENTGSIQPANKSMGGINWAKDGARKIIDDGWKITKSYRW